MLCYERKLLVNGSSYHRLMLALWAAKTMTLRLYLE
jgi:hypothetical protein